MTIIEIISVIDIMLNHTTTHLLPDITITPSVVYQVVQ